MSISKYFRPVSPDKAIGEAPASARSTKKADNASISSLSRSSIIGLAALQEEWRIIYAETLPAAARSKNPAQPKWPVTLDHCFGRIILDNAVGKDKPWMQVVKSPAIKHMNQEQLQAAIKLGNQILTGEANLVELDESSLALRGKKSKASTSSQPAQKKRKSITQDDERPTKKIETTIDLTEDDEAAQIANGDDEELEAMINGADKTPFQKLCLRALLQIPAGQFSTYGALAKYLDSSPRAVGNAMRGNPFAPRVPCHRILAADRSIGGFGGSWGAEGKHANEKLELLKAEGVRFDSKGKVLGPIFTSYR